MFARSFKTRLVGGAIIWICAGLLASGLVLSALFRQLVTSQFDHDLSDHVEELRLALTLLPDKSVSLPRPLSDPRFQAPGSGVYWQVRGPVGPPLRSLSLEQRDLPLVQASASSFEPEQVVTSSGPIRLLQVRTYVGESSLETYLSVAIEGRLIDADMRQFNFALFSALALVAAGLILAASAQVYFGLRPFSLLRQALGEVHAGKREQLPDDIAIEIAPLVTDLNKMMHANREMVSRARVQAGNLAHGLKTPLALLEYQARELEERGLHEAGQRIAEQCTKMRRQVEYQMARARAASRAVPGQVVDAVSQLRVIVEALSKLHGPKCIDLKVEAAEPALVRCDADDFSEMVANIIDNAGRWSASRVVISLEQSMDCLRICVDDDGPGIPEIARERIFALGERLDEALPGSGLGLAITRDLAEHHGGRVRVEASRLGGAQFILELQSVVNDM